MSVTIPKAIYVEFSKYIQGLPCVFMNGNQNIENEHRPVKEIHSAEHLNQRTTNNGPKFVGENENDNTFTIKAETFPAIQLPVRVFLSKNNQIEFEAIIYDMDNLDGQEYFSCRSSDINYNKQQENWMNTDKKSNKRKRSEKNTYTNRRASTFIQITHAPQNHQHLISKLYCNLSTALSHCRDGTTASGWRFWCIEIVDPITNCKKMVPIHKFRKNHRYLSGHWMGGGFARCSQANSITRDIMQHFAEKPRSTGGERYCQQIHTKLELVQFDPQKKTINEFTLHDLNSIYNSFLRKSIQ